MPPVISSSSRPLRRRPDVRIVVRTTVPAWLFDRTAPRTSTFNRSRPIRASSRSTACGSTSANRRSPGCGLLPHVRSSASSEKRACCGQLGADLVVGDIPPLAFAAAERAGVRSMAIGNFTWDWIYGIYPAFDELAPDVIPTIRAAYATATRALRLPFHGGFEPMAAVTRDIPLIARRSKREPGEIRQALGMRRRPAGRARLVRRLWRRHPGGRTLTVRALHAARSAPGSAGRPANIRIWLRQATW